MSELLLHGSFSMKKRDTQSYNGLVYANQHLYHSPTISPPSSHTVRVQPYGAYERKLYLQGNIMIGRSSVLRGLFV
jgi:hypothetical protein